MEQAQGGHWREYLMEAAGLGLFMISACVLTTIMEHPGSPVRQGIDSAFVRRAVIGVGMGLTAIGLLAGGLLAAGLGRLLGTLWFGVKPMAPGIYLATAVALVLVAMAACVIPAARLARRSCRGLAERITRAKHFAFLLQLNSRAGETEKNQET